MKIYFIWLIGVILWNFGYPSATPITNYEYELERQNTISRVRLLDPAYLPQFVTEFETLMKESIL